MSHTTQTAKTCPVCHREFLRLSVHMPHCTGPAADASHPLVARSTAHIVPTDTLTRSQRLQDHVSELDVARLMLAVEQGSAIKLGLYRWAAPAGHPGAAMFNRTVQEAIRTGLVRDYRDPGTGEHHLIPALVHLRDTDGTSACKFAGEGMGPMRARLLDELVLIDCLNCEQVVATGEVRRV